ncbi:Nucleoside-diphosphate-sugar epimerases [hydrothermal vent metagenome]|uniref:Nucleoside-diphosphate-sugar epimerases n=1 Tax=hydrothermal vent metagenome TaxID=652676 RepID=A0A3B0SM69_9ZZZZ
MNHLFCFGLGYTGQALAQALQKQNWQISGTTREKETQRRLEKEGFQTFLFNSANPLPANVLDSVSHVLLSIPPGENGDPVFLQHGSDLTARAKNLKWVGYLSTTGVYGDRQGGWVDENSLLSPSTKRGEKRLKAETDWLSLFENDQLPVHLFRLAGIYGPGSNQLEKVAAGTARRRIKPGQVFSRIHVDDIVGMLIASMAQPNPGRAYNLCDDEAVPPQDVVAFAADLLRVEPPEEIAFNRDEMSPMGLSFFAESKKVSNQRIKNELGYDLKYPTYREGLTALLATIGMLSKGK